MSTSSLPTKTPLPVSPGFRAYHPLLSTGESTTYVAAIVAGLVGSPVRGSTSGAAFETSAVREIANNNAEPAGADAADAAPPLRGLATGPAQYSQASSFCPSSGYLLPGPSGQRSRREQAKLVPCPTFKLISRVRAGPNIQSVAVLRNGCPTPRDCTGPGARCAMSGCGRGWGSVLSLPAKYQSHSTERPPAHPRSRGWIPNTLVVP